MRRLKDVVFNQTPLVLPGDASVQHACHEMAMRRVGSVLVTGPNGALAGILTGRDVVARVVAKGRDPEHTRVDQVMTTPTITMTPDHKSIDALRLMWARDFRHVPIVKDGRILGVVTRGDFSGIEQDHFDTERDLWEHMR